MRHLVAIAKVLGEVARDGERAGQAQAGVVVVADADEDQHQRLQGQDEVGETPKLGPVAYARRAQLDDAGREAEGQDEEAQLLAQLVAEEDLGGEEGERHYLDYARDGLVEASEALCCARAACNMYRRVSWIFLCFAFDFARSFRFVYSRGGRA